MTIGDKETELVYKYVIGNKKENLAQVIELEEIQLPTSPEERNKDEWQKLEVGEWTMSHMAQYICWSYEAIYDEKPPYVAFKLAASGLKTAMGSLYMKLPSTHRKKPTESYKDFVNWLLNHNFYTATPTNLTSDKVITQYVVELTKSLSKPIGLDPFDM